MNFRVSLNFLLFLRETLTPALLKSSHHNKNEIKTFFVNFSTLQGLSNDKSFRIRTAINETPDVNLSINVNEGGRVYLSLALLRS